MNKFGLNRSELTVFKKLSTPIKIQDFIDGLSMNWQEVTFSPRMVLKKKKAHCLDGALLAATALWIHGEKPLLLDLKAEGDDSHVVALYQRNGYWGAVSKTNHSSLRFRDPVYKTIRELALSYFHEYFLNKDGKKVLRSYSKTFDVSKMGTDWITSEKNLDYLGDILDSSPHFPIVPNKNKRLIRRADQMERRAGRLTEWKKF